MSLFLFLYTLPPWLHPNPYNYMYWWHHPCNSDPQASNVPDTVCSSIHCLIHSKSITRIYSWFLFSPSHLTRHLTVILTFSLLHCPHFLLRHQTQIDRHIHSCVHWTSQTTYDNSCTLYWVEALELEAKPTHVSFVSYLTSFVSLGNLLDHSVSVFLNME